MNNDNAIFKIIKKCQKDPAFFINNFCKIKHPKLGTLPFKLFSYQKKCLDDFQKHRFNIFKKCRQCGISTLTGSFSLWYAMFHNDKTILIVSKRDDDAKEYLTKNIKFPYNNLPEWMRSLWTPATMNEHTLAFKNGSVIRSLTSSPDTLRSNASSLNIIDEAAFIDKMEEMWAGGWNTMQHGGSAIVISTPKGVGNWYWKTWKGAVEKQNDFNPILINWWDMDWELKYKDELNNIETVIAPTKGIKVLHDKNDIEKYGPGPNGVTYWSPWLEKEYRNLSTQGDDSKFRQEVLAEFIGSGNTVLSKSTLQHISSTVSDDYIEIDKVDYINSSLNEYTILDFRGMLRIWEKPYTKVDAEKVITKAKLNNIDPKSLATDQTMPHTYVIGADPSSGEADDYCGLQVLDITTGKQVAELRIKETPKIFARMIDYVGRLYNNAHVVCERSGIGQTVVQELCKDLSYPNLYRHMRTTSTLKVKYNRFGFPTTSSSKPLLIKGLLDHTGEGQYTILSRRLYNELCIFVHLRNNRYGNEPGVGNTDDLVLAFCLAVIGINTALMNSGIVLSPIHNMDISNGLYMSDDKIIKKTNTNVISPIGIMSEFYTNKSNSKDELLKFTKQLGSMPFAPKDKLNIKTDSVIVKKNILRYFRQ